MLNYYDLKYIIKKILIITGVICLTSLINSCEVHALSVEPSDIRYYDTAGHIIPHSSSSFGGYTYYQANVSMNVYAKSVRYLYNSGQFGSFNGKTVYTMSFTAYHPNTVVPVYTIGTNGTNYSCYSNESEVYHTDNTLGYSVSAVICPNVSITNVVYIGALVSNINNDSMDGYWGISQMISITSQDNSSSIVGALEDVKEQQQQTNDKLDKLEDSITDSSTDGAKYSADSFFNSFDDSDYGLSDVITMPLSFINKITSSTCTPLTLPLPFVNTNATLPCMNQVYSQYFGSFLTLYQSITLGITSYWVCINIFGIIKGFKDPESDRIEVFDL